MTRPMGQRQRGVTPIINEMLLPRLVDGIACDMLLNPVTVDEELICLRGRPSSTIRDTNS
jgi:hypothetical protein